MLGWNRCSGFLFCVFLYFMFGPSIAVPENSTIITVNNDNSNNVTQTPTEKITLKSFQNESVNVDATENINASALNGSNAHEVYIPIGTSAENVSKVVQGPECIIKRGWFRWNVHLQTGRSYFSAPDCSLQVCNEKGGLDFYSCNRLDAWDVLRPTIDREVNEGQLQCLKTGCI